MCPSICAKRRQKLLYIGTSRIHIHKKSTRVNRCTLELSLFKTFRMKQKRRQNGLRETERPEHIIRLPNRHIGLYFRYSERSSQHIKSSMFMFDLFISFLNKIVHQKHSKCTTLVLYTISNPTTKILIIFITHTQRINKIVVISYKKHIWCNTTKSTMDFEIVY